MYLCVIESPIWRAWYLVLSLNIICPLRWRIELANEMMRDPLAAKKFKLSRTVASYKLRDGLAKGLEEELIEKLKKCFFSLNLDEATSLTHHKILTLLVSYFCHLKKEIVVEHLTSLNLPIINSLKVYDAVETFFRSNELPWNHLLSTLMDSCGVMRGVKNGFETKLRDQVAPNLLDIDSDACHHIHNATKKFTKDTWKRYIVIFITISNGQRT